jgi:hypothetical protein
MPRFEAPPSPPNTDLSELTARVAELEARVDAFERVFAIASNGSVTITALGALKLSSAREIELSVARTVVKLNPGLIDFQSAAANFNTGSVTINSVIVNVPIGIVRCLRLDELSRPSR